MLSTLSPNNLVLQLKKLERAISRHPHVADAVVVSLNTPAGETRIKAFVEPGDPPPTAESIREYFNENWAGNPIPIDFIFRSIPRTPSGKVIRQQLINSEA
ncbi:AMP-binding enzyme [Desulfallas thermosapovorans]|uniref:AMP-binding enzyme n=1 Tax=Desulfallas thermosapovorans DSM 6562 TaxID=1121431 RepID=A0A5S4ZQF1_9FIRM|nr:hypothetical protein [Desulfallas thermosapovorans]TYO93356.1 AMP-binding enzyme [Desulfallas thermosapovorans DSM 6562]